MADNRLRLLATLDDKVSTRLDKIRDQVNLIGGKGTAASLFGNIGAKVAGGALDLVGRAAGSAADFINSSIDSASNLNETLSKSRVVFGQSAREIEAWGETAAQRFGISQNSAIAAAASFADLFNTVGLGAVPSKNMSKSLVELSADLASFHNIAGGSPEVLEKLRSGLSGEAEPMRRLGVFLSETKVRAKAMQLGLGGAHGELTDGAKIVARYNIILDETTTAQGDFARTADQLANKQRTSSALLEDQQAVLGEKLLPAQLAATNAQIDLITGIGALADALSGKATPESIALAVALGKLSEEQGRAAVASLRAKEAAEEQAAAYTAYENNRGRWVNAASALAETLPEKLEIAKAKAIKVAQKTPGEIAAGLLSRRDAWESALDNLNTATENKLSRMAEIAKIKALLSGDEIANGLRSADPVVRAAAAALKDAAEGRLNELQGAASRSGQLAARALADALKDKTLTVKQSADLVSIQVKNSLGQLPSSAYGWGAATGREYGSGLRSKAKEVAAAAAYLAKAAANNLEIRSPAKEGPLSRGGPKVWGAKFGSEWADGLASKAGGVGIAASAYAGAVAMSGNRGQIGPGGAPVTIPIVIDGREIARVADQNLFYRHVTSPR